MVIQNHKPHHPHQNTVELCSVKYVKNHAQVLMDRVRAPENLWLLAQEYICDVHNLCADPNKNWKIPSQVVFWGYTSYLTLITVLLV